VPNWLVGLTLAWPLLQGGLTTGLLHEAEAQLRSIAAQTDAFRLSVRVEVEQAALSVRAAKAAAAATERAVVAARDQLRLAEARYSTGLGSAIELGDAQVAYTAAAGQAVAARYSVAQARAALVTALGKR
jgi:outer membrane protein TolC